MPDKVSADVLKNSLSGLAGVDNVSVHPESGTLVIKSSLPISVLQEKIEATGQRAVIKGYGGTNLSKTLLSSLKRSVIQLFFRSAQYSISDSVQAAVAIVGGECGFAQGKVQGVVRFIQADEETCIIDGTIDGLSPGLHGLHIHEFGDISEGCNKYAILSFTGTFHFFSHKRTVLFQSGPTFFFVKRTSWSS